MTVAQLPFDVELRVLAVTLAAIAVPGWALLALGRAWRTWAPLQAWALALVLGVAFYPVLYALAGALGAWATLDRTALLAILGLALLVATWRLGRGAGAIVRFARLEQVAIVVVLATLATRLWVAHIEPFPAWSDSLHHVLLTELTARDGRLPSTMKPFFPIPLGRYHLGLYALTASVQTLAGVPAHVAVTWVAQVLSGLCGLGVYLVLDRHAGRVPAVIGAIIAGLISHQPAFYVNWGRFTQLAAQTILLPAWLLAWEMLRRAVAAAAPPGERAGGGEASVPPPLTVGAPYACLLLAAVFLIHLRVGRVPRAAARSERGGGGLAGTPRAAAPPPRARARRRGAAGRDRARRAAPDRNHRAVRAEPLGALPLPGRARGPPGTRLHGDPEYFAFSRESLAYLFAGGPALAALALLAAVALVRRSALAALFTAWSVLLLALGEAHALNIPLLNVTNLGAVLIMLYLPASLIAALGVGEVLAWRRAGAAATTAVLLGFLVLGALGARDRVRQLEPSRFFVTDADLRAIDWLGRQHMALGVGAIRATFWLPRAPHGVDAGYWIPYLIGRRTTVGR